MTVQCCVYVRRHRWSPIPVCDEVLYVCSRSGTVMDDSQKEQSWKVRCAIFVGKSLWKVRCVIVPLGDKIITCRLFPKTEYFLKFRLPPKSRKELMSLVIPSTCVPSTKYNSQMALFPDVCAWFCTWRPTGRKNTRWNTHQRPLCLSGSYRQFFCRIVVFRRERCSNRGIGATRCGGAIETPMSCCMCEPMETAQSLGDDTHAVVKRPKWAWEYGIDTERGPPCRWVASLAHR